MEGHLLEQKSAAVSNATRRRMDCLRDDDDDDGWWWRADVMVGIKGSSYLAIGSLLLLLAVDVGFESSDGAGGVGRKEAQRVMTDGPESQANLAGFSI